MKGIGIATIVNENESFDGKYITLVSASFDSPINSRSYPLMNYVQLITLFNAVSNFLF